MMTCKACGAAAEDGPKVSGAVRPLCPRHWHGQSGWSASGEGMRWLKQPVPKGETEDSMFARAFTDWLTRARAELRNGAKP